MHSCFRRVPILLLLVLGALAAGVFLSSHAAIGLETERVAPAHHLRHGFRNLDPQAAYPLAARARRLLHRTFLGWPPRGPALVVVPNDGAQLRSNGTVPTVTWVGHATLLIQLDGLNILTDPNWSDGVGPIALLRPRRLIAPGVPFEDLPRIDAVIISHDHYDHLDAATVKRLARAHSPRFFVPLGLKAWFRGLGISNVVELDWWGVAQLGPLTFVSVPSQHTSGRTLFDQDERLWSSWVVSGTHERLFFGGDTGYHAGFTDIARRWGPFDVVALPIGGYSAFQSHHPNHLNPEEAVQAFEDLHGHLLVPIHWGTFELNREPSREPPERLLREARRRGIEAQVDVLSPGQTIHW